jgi:hypothetical protein
MREDRDPYPGSGDYGMAPSRSPEKLSRQENSGRAAGCADTSPCGDHPPWSVAWGESLVPVIDEIERHGVTTYAGIADQLNRRAVPTSTGARWYATSAQKLMQLIDVARSEIAARDAENEQAAIRSESEKAREERKRQRALRNSSKAGFRWKYGCSHWVAELLSEYSEWRQSPGFAKLLDDEVAGLATVIWELCDIVEKYDCDHKHRQVIQRARDLVQWMP